MESVGFKEWAVVCEAMGRGRQSIILRKGGVAEGGQGFAFKHREFFLFPTWFHEQPQKVRWETGTELPAKPSRPNRGAETAAGDNGDTGSVAIRYAVRLESWHTVVEWDVVEALEPFHVLQPEVVRERFQYDDAPGIHVGVVRVYRLDPVWSFPGKARYRGCRSWVELPDVPNHTRLAPVLPDQEHNTAVAQVTRALAQGTPSTAP
jgi:hypothetical protein